MPWFLYLNLEDISPDKQAYCYVPPSPRLIPLTLLKSLTSQTSFSSIRGSSFPVSSSHSLPQPTALMASLPGTTIP
ncbi:hypothetical protein I302_100446 [Kwoniella bestiolae CBS 10118]|uniref:Uncharacterized protein n=1 Tax=Kwoniella bestiolae CBS 10118 TaxID=1296100 RepID=A0AAJ8M4V5_9TREE